MNTNMTTTNTNNTNTITLNQDNTLVILTNLKNKAYEIYETYSFKPVNLEDDYQQLLGPIKFFVPFYESNLVFFVGSSENNNFPDTQIMVWDDFRKKKSGIIMLNSIVYDLKLRKEALFVMNKNQVLVYNIVPNISLISVLEDAEVNLHMQISYEENPIILGFQSKLNKSQIKLTKFRYKSENIDNKEKEKYSIENSINNMNSSSNSNNINSPNSNNNSNNNTYEIHKIDGRLHYVLTTLFQNISKFKISSKVST